MEHNISSLVLLVKAQSHIEREAFMNALRENGLSPMSSERDLSRKTTNTTVDLAFEGYSAMFDGFSIYIPFDEKSKAEQVLNDFRFRLRQEEKINPPAQDYFQKFYFMSMMSVFMPVLTHLAGFYFLFLGLKNRQKIRPFIFSVCLMIYVASSFLGYLIVVSYLEKLV